MEEGTINIQNIREHKQKTFNTLSRFWLGGGEGLSESFKKENLRQKSFFTECSSRDLWKMISADVKLIKTTKNKRVGGSIRHKMNVQKLNWNTININIKGACIFHLILVGILILILSVKNRGSCLMDKIC